MDISEQPRLNGESAAGPGPNLKIGQAMTLSDSLSLGERRLRWFIVGWITLSTILNLIDRNTLSILAPTLEREFGLTNRDYSNIVSAFLISYTVMYTVGGRFVDRVGEKIGMTACILWWSVATMLHSLARGGLSLGIFRFLLGVGEPGNYPAALRVTTRWFAKAERACPSPSSRRAVPSAVFWPYRSFPFSRCTLAGGPLSSFLVSWASSGSWFGYWCTGCRRDHSKSPPAPPNHERRRRRGARENRCSIW